MFQPLIGFDHTNLNRGVGNISSEATFKAKNMDIKTAEAADLVYSGKNAEGENEFIGTKKQWQRAENFEQGDDMAKNDTLEEVADKEAVKIAVDSEEVLCEKCEGETTHRLVGDEWHDTCVDCQWVTHN